jgi:NADH pyrophosphatase NudC (nudix superfamily)
MLDHCPGAASLRTPVLSVKKCPQCGEEVETFSNDISVRCTNCGFVVYNDTESCIRWCKHARECVGEDTYRRLMARVKDREKK